MTAWYEDTGEFDADYFERGVATGKSLYRDYRWIPELTIPMAARILELFPRAAWGSKVLDFGCAKGYLVKALSLLGRDATGVDISSYAINMGRSEGINTIHHTLPFVRSDLGQYRLTIAKDVLEHVWTDQLPEVLAFLRKVTDELFVIVPLSNKKGQYVIPAFENDVTHRVRMPMSGWTTILEATGFRVISADYCVPGLKEAYRKFDAGNGFLRCQ